MLVEHIIEPSALVELAKSARNCREFEREFSKPSPRVIGEYPKLKKFRRLALQSQSVDASEIEKARLEELLRFLSEKQRVERNSKFDGAITFIENLKKVEQDFFSGFHLLHNNVKECEFQANVLCVDQFEQGIEPLPNQIAMPKVTEIMCETLGELLRLSKHITVVDPYICMLPGVWKTLIAFIEHAVTDTPVSEKSFSIMFNSEHKNGRSCEHLKKALLDEKPELAEQYLKIDFYDIRENGNEAIHNRYLITELGAVSLPYGLQETNADECDDVTLLNEELYAKRFSQYTEFGGVIVADHAAVE
ncbi:hypothetical protein [Photobacterium alginatilyticum]|uniref:Uncharacterized protein n=1 Tax=Photobacterium alginatilyticum TaxID=1775171 RepID=A0ABW9YJ71_9GAMM|nr:hypothetical protein [Photobacterium alginatilyticum]NBI53828.1 hypothetical protein [Photobacterium alginatilyticum]